LLDEKEKERKRKSVCVCVTIDDLDYSIMPLKSILSVRPISTPTTSLEENKLARVQLDSALVTNCTDLFLSLGYKAR